MLCWIEENAVANLGGAGKPKIIAGSVAKVGLAQGGRGAIRMFLVTFQRIFEFAVYAEAWLTTSRGEEIILIIIESILVLHCEVC